MDDSACTRYNPPLFIETDTICKKKQAISHPSIELFKYDNFLFKFRLYMFRRLNKWLTIKTWLVVKKL